MGQTMHPQSLLPALDVLLGTIDSLQSRFHKHVRDSLVSLSSASGSIEQVYDTIEPRLFDIYDDLLGQPSRTNPVSAGASLLLLLALIDRRIDWCDAGVVLGTLVEAAPSLPSRFRTSVYAYLDEVVATGILPEDVHVPAAIAHAVLAGVTFHIACQVAIQALQAELVEANAYPESIEPMLKQWAHVERTLLGASGGVDGALGRFRQLLRRQK